MSIATGIASLILAFTTQDASFHAELTSRLATLATASQAETALVAGTPVNFAPLLAQIYSERQGASLWVVRPDAAIEIPALIDRFADADSHGLDAHAYPLRQLRDLYFGSIGGSATDVAALDVLLTDTVLGYLADLTGQRLRMPLPADAEAAPSRNIDLAALTERLAAGTESPSLAIEAAAPAGEDYAELRVLLRQMRHIERTGGWPVVPEGPSLRPGQRDPRVPVLRARLLDPAAVDVPDSLRLVFDDELVEAVRQAQRRFGLLRDGIAGKRTLAALNTSAEVRRRQIEFSLERLRRLPRELGDRYVRVDVLQGRLQVVERDSVVAQMRTIVGKPERPTPMVSSRITSLEVNPYWNIPQSLAREDVLPKVLRDPAYLIDRNICVYADWRPGAPLIDPHDVDWPSIDPEQLSYKLQQQPGPKNPLGQVKFLFYNPYAVYIHDTPNSYKFRLPRRFFSSGCVRVEKPRQLARALLGERYPEFTGALDSGETVKLKLDRPVNVHLVYQTAWVDETGEPCFRDDVYGYDTEMAAILTERTELAEAAPSLPGTKGTRVDVDESGVRVIADATAALP